MSRLAALVVLTATVCLVQGQAVTTTNSVAPATSSLLVVNTPTVSHSVVVNSATASNTHSITPTKVAPKVTTSVKPTVTPSPSPKANTTAYMYHLLDAKNKNLTCLLMVADISVELTYNTSKNTSKTVHVHFVRDAKNESRINIESTSVCFSYNEYPHPNASLNLEYISKSSVDPYRVRFTFAAKKEPGNQQWYSTGMAVSFTFRDEDFPDYYPESDKPKDKSELFSQTKSSLFDESFQRMELTRPYICESNTTIGGFSSNVTNNTLTVSLLVRSLEVQAFDFPNGANFTPNAARRCLNDGTRKGDTIVPIAVGAALALLVIIVIIAYLIGKVRNRRKSSYEQLK